MANKYEGLPFRVDRRSPGSVRMAELYLTYERKQSPTEMRFIRRLVKELGPDIFLGYIETQYKGYVKHRQKHGYVGQCIGGENLRKANIINIRLRKASGDLEKMAGSIAGVRVSELGERKVGDEGHYAALIRIQNAQRLSDGEWREFLAREAQTDEHRKKVDAESRKSEEALLEGEEDLKVKPGVWIFRALQKVRDKIKDPRVAEAVARYVNTPYDLSGELVEAAVRWYVQFYPHKALGFPSIDNISYLTEVLKEIDGNATFRPVRVYSGPEETDLREMKISDCLGGEVKIAEAMGMLKAVRDQLGMSVLNRQRSYNKYFAERYFHELGAEPWRAFKAAIQELREALAYDNPIIHARFSGDKEKLKELPKRTRLGKSHRNASELLALIDKGKESGMTEWEAMLDLVKMRFSQPYTSSAAVELRKARMRKDEQKN